MLRDTPRFSLVLHLDRQVLHVNSKCIACWAREIEPCSKTIIGFRQGVERVSGTGRDIERVNGRFSAEGHADEC